MAFQGQHSVLGLSSAERMLSKKALLPAGQSASDWFALTCALQGEREDYASYLSELEAFVTECYAKPERLSTDRATQWHRIALTVLALGGDPTAFGSSGGKPVNLIADGTYQYVNGALDAQGLNGLLYALLTLDAKAYEIPAGSLYTRERILKEILSQQNGDGGFGLIAGGSEADITAMSLQAIAPYPEGKAAVSRALDYLSRTQAQDGSFGSAESTAQVVLALCCLGLDPETDVRFSKKTDVLDALLSFQSSGGGFVHSRGGKDNFLATQQSLLALTAVQRLRSGGKNVFDFTDYTPPRGTESSRPLTVALCALSVALCVTGVLLLKRKARERKA